MSVVANASVESRKRLVRIMSHPRVQPIALQFLLGQRIWTKDMLSILKLILTISGWSTISFQRILESRIAQTPHSFTVGRTTSCEPCIRRNEECSGFSHSQDVESASQPCNRCGRTCANNSMRDHLRICKGKCSECEKTRVPCIQKSANGCGDRCDILGYEYANFSHEDHVILNDFKVCHRCENDIAWAYFDRS